ncbi:hypothetical protein BJX65DRAFT_53904 [Aspergillus insuetus]
MLTKEPKPKTNRRACNSLFPWTCEPSQLLSDAVPCRAKTSKRTGYYFIFLVLSATMSHASRPPIYHVAMPSRMCPKYIWSR